MSYRAVELYVGEVQKPSGVQHEFSLMALPGEVFDSFLTSSGLSVAQVGGAVIESSRVTVDGLLSLSRGAYVAGQQVATVAGQVLTMVEDAAIVAAEIAGSSLSAVVDDSSFSGVLATVAHVFYAARGAFPVPVVDLPSLPANAVSFPSLGGGVVYYPPASAWYSASVLVGDRFYSVNDNWATIRGCYRWLWGAASQYPVEHLLRSLYVYDVIDDVLRYSYAPIDCAGFARYGLTDYSNTYWTPGGTVSVQHISLPAWSSAPVVFHRPEFSGGGGGGGSSGGGGASGTWGVGGLVGKGLVGTFAPGGGALLVNGSFLLLDDDRHLRIRRKT